MCVCGMGGGVGEVVQHFGPRLPAKNLCGQH